MGQHYQSEGFSKECFDNFKQALRRETSDLLQEYKRGGIGSRERSFGLELETWLIGEDGRPIADNQLILQELNDPAVVPELSQFNLEINASPKILGGSSLADLHHELSQTFLRINKTLKNHGQKMVHIGVYPCSITRP